MALIRSLEPGTGSGRPPQSEVDGTYVTINDPDRGTVLKITTYGSDTRKSGPKPSQVVELDQEMAQKLAAIIREAFAPVGASAGGEPAPKAPGRHRSGT